MTTTDLFFKNAPNETRAPLILLFGGAPPAGQIRVFDGSDWVAAAVKRWDGSAWISASVSVWDGSTWQVVS